MANSRKTRAKKNKEEESVIVEISEISSKASCEYDVRKHLRMESDDFDVTRFRLSLSTALGLSDDEVELRAVDYAGTEIWASSPTANKVTIHGDFKGQSGNTEYVGMIGLDRISADTYIYFRMYVGGGLVASSLGADFGGSTDEDAKFEAIRRCPT